MQYLQLLLVGLAASVLGKQCHHNNCYKAIARYEREMPTFCSKYLAAPTATPPHALSKYEPSHISSACSCLVTTSSVPTHTPTTIPTIPLPTSDPTTTLSASTCSRSSAAACPTPYTPCCAYLCAEAQVPFLVCSQENETVLAQCQKCGPETSSVGTVTPTPTTTEKSVSTTEASTCSRSSAAACPTPANKCCAWLCAEAQVPFDVCSEEDTSGEFAVCSKCPA